MELDLVINEPAEVKAPSMRLERLGRSKPYSMTGACLRLAYEGHSALATSKIAR